MWRAGVAAVVIAAAALRFAGLGSVLWYDEIVTLVESARRPFIEVVTYFPDVNVHPFYSVLAHASLEVFGDSAWSLRLPAALFGIASVLMAYVLAARWSPRVEAWAAAAVLAFSYQHIWFSQNARGYTMMGFFALLATYFLIRAATTDQKSNLFFYALTSAAGVYTHLTMAFVVAGHALVLVIGKAAGWRAADRPDLRPLLAAWTGAAVLSLALYAPFIPALMSHFGAEEPQQAVQVATGRWAIAEVLKNLLSGSGIIGAAATALAAMIGALSFLRRDPLPFALLVVPAIVAGAAIVVLGQPIRPRFFFFAAGAAAIFAGRGLGVVAAVLSSRTPAPVPVVLGLAGIVVVASAAGLPRNYQIPKQNFDGAVRYLETEAASGVVIGTVGLTCLPVERYFKKTDWPCLRTTADLDALMRVPGQVRLMTTLTDYIEDAALGDRVRTACAPVQRFPGTLGGGDVVICDPRRSREASGSGR